MVEGKNVKIPTQLKAPWLGDFGIYAKLPNSIKKGVWEEKVFGAGHLRGDKVVF